MARQAQSFDSALRAFAQDKPPFYPDKTKLLVVLDAEGKEQPISAASDWPGAAPTSSPACNW
jgi:hypothetical protein